jgi:gliding motility-associated-like protein
MRYLFLLLLSSLTLQLYSQCSNAGQNPSSAFPVCGTATFTQTSVPSCAGRTIPVPVCASTTVYADVNPYYYKFLCYTSGPLEFSITPAQLSDDYDWQLFDITGKNPNDIYTDASLFVACNWSGNTGVTGTSNTASTTNGCEGTGVPTITKSPNMIAGRLYLLMVSHFTSTNQSGYNLTFSSASASLITDPVAPAVDRASSPCGGQSIAIKLNKAVRCNTLAADGSDFTISTNPVIGSVFGVGCSVGFDTDSIIISLASPLPTGSYNFNVKNGTDGNTLIDFCGNSVLDGGNSKNIDVYQKPSATFTTQVIRETCFSDTLRYAHNANNGTNKWVWTFDGNPTSSTSSSQIVTYSNFNSRKVKLVVSNPSCIDSVEQNIPITDHSLIPKFTVSRDTTCPNNPEVFTDSTKGLVNSWNWDFANGQTSNIKNPPSQTYPILPVNKVYTTKLIVTNTVGCKDSTTKNIFVRGTIPTEFDSIIPPPCSSSQIKLYFKQAMICSSITPSGSEFSISGPTATNVIAATINCVNGVGTTVTLQLSNPLQTGTYQVNLNTGIDGNTIINDCGIETLPGSVSFKSFSAVDASFTSFDKAACVSDTLFLYHTVANGENSWKWYVDDVLKNNSTNYTFPYNKNSTTKIKLVTANEACSDSTEQTFNLEYDDIKSKFIINNPIVCPNETVAFTDTSSGKIVTWNWLFGNGQTSSDKNPSNQLYPKVNYPINTGSNYTDYTVRLIVGNAIPCYDTSYNKLRVASNCFIQVASAFTPNGDGLNDFLYPLNAYKAVDIVFKVYNRFGRLIYVSYDNVSKWEGKFRGQDQPSGTYVWTLDYTEKDTGKKISLKGTSVLIR